MISADIQITVNALFSLTGVAVMLYLWLFHFKLFQIDQFRLEMFQLRDQMFDYAAEQNILDNPGYRDVRRFMNGSIRYAGIFSIWLFFFVAIFARKALAETESPWEHIEEKMSDLSSEQKKRLEEFYLSNQNLLVRYLFKKSLFFSALIRGSFLIASVSSRLYGSALKYKSKVEETILTSKDIHALEDRCYAHGA